MAKNNKNGKFCFDVSSLSKDQQIDLAKTLKTSVDNFNQKLKGENKDE